MVYVLIIDVPLKLMLLKRDGYISFKSDGNIPTKGLYHTPNMTIITFEESKGGCNDLVGL